MRASESSTTVINDRVMPILLKNHGWVAPWVIRVSDGLTGTVANLLKDIEDIFDNNPAIAFLRITDEINDDDDLPHSYQRTLIVFIQAKDSLWARDKALDHVVRQAIMASQGMCRICGDKLEKKTFGTKNSSSYILFCLVCYKPNLASIDPAQ